MKQRPRIYYTENQKAQMWERRQKGKPLSQTAQLFDVCDSINFPRLNRLPEVLGGAVKNKILGAIQAETRISV